jgi:hypothetical protein
MAVTEVIETKIDEEYYLDAEGAYPATMILVQYCRRE